MQKRLNAVQPRPAPARRALAAAAVAAMVAGCGGGAEAPPETGPVVQEAPAAPPAVVLSGVAATGAPMAGAAVKVVSANGAEVCATVADSAGQFSCTLSAGAVAPFAIAASTADQTMYSSAATAVSGTVNITPLTTLIVARLSPSGDPSRFAAELKADPAIATAGRLDARVAEVTALIAPLSNAAGAVVNPLTGQFSANGNGHDKVLDALQITIRPEGNSSNIEVTMKVTPASNDAPPMAVNFKSNETTPPPPVSQIRSQDLAASGVSTLVTGFIDRMRACYALPLAERISGVAAGATTAIGGASTIQAPACKAIFADNDPAGYLDNGLVVGSGRAFAGIFREASTGAAFDSGNFEYRWASGDVFITFRSITTSGAIGNSTLTLRQQGDQLKAVGNQYAYDASVRPYILQREFPLQPAFSYLGTGYNVNIANRIDATGNPVFREAVVTTPTGRQLLYRPQAGRSQLAIVRANGELSSTGVEVFKAAFIDPAVAGNPADKDATLVYTTNQLNDDQLRSIPNQGAWTIEWVHADSAVPNVKQTYRTIDRAATIGEARLARFAQFSPALKAEWLARADVQAYRGIVFGPVSATAPNQLVVEAPDGTAGWTVPDGAVLPTSLLAFGRTPTNASFNDSTALATSDRKATVLCTKQSNADLHCDRSTPVTQFAEGGKLWNIELWGRNLRQIEYSKQVALWRLPD